VLVKQKIRIAESIKELNLDFDIIFTVLIYYLLVVQMGTA